MDFFFLLSSSSSFACSQLGRNQSVVRKVTVCDTVDVGMLRVLCGGLGKNVGTTVHHWSSCHRSNRRAGFRRSNAVAAEARFHDSVYQELVLTID